MQVTRDASGNVTLTQERFTVHFPNAPALEWKIPLTYSVAGSATPVSILMTSKTMELADIPAERAVKFNVEGAGNYRVQYDEASWKLLLAELPKMSTPDRVNLLSDAWALVQANRAPLSLYLDLVEKLPTRTELAEREQIMTAFDYINRLMIGDPKRDQFQKYARSILRPSFDEVGWEPKSGEPARHRDLAREPDHCARQSERPRRHRRMSRPLRALSRQTGIASARSARAGLAGDRRITPTSRPGSNCMNWD